MKSPIYLLKQKLQNNFFFLPFIQFSIREESMIPFFSPGDSVIVSRISYLITDPQKSDIVIVKNPEKDMLQKYLIKQIKKVTKEKIYVVGFNKEKSIDSRHFGYIPKKNIIGKMIFKVS